MTSNTNGQSSYTNKEPINSDEEQKKYFTSILSLIWSKIYERFPTINAAFRFFDSDYDHKISFNDFA